MKDPLKDYRSFVLADHLQDQMLKDMQGLQDPFKELRSSLGGLQDQMLKDMQGPQDPFKELRSSLGGLQDQMLKDMQGPQDPFKELRSSLGGLQDQMLKDMQGPQDPFKELRSSLGGLQDQMLKDMQGPQDPFKELREFQLSIQGLQPTFESVEREVSIGSDGTITLDTLNIDQSELQEICDQVLEQALVNHPAKRFGEIAQKIIEEIRRLKPTLLEKILQWFIFPTLLYLAFSFINPIADHYIKGFLSANKREAKKYINQQTRSIFENRHILGAFRYVATDTLNVRLKGSIQSPSIGILRFGDVVVLLKKGRSWSLVEWRDREGQAAIQGWVFSRYLEKFK